MDGRVPKWIGPHRVVRKIGEGGMGTVFEVRGPDEQPYAAKLLSPDAANHPEFRKRFLREAKIASVVNHPGVVSIFELDVDERLNTPFLLMELLEGEALDARIKRLAAAKTPFPLQEATDIALQIAEALEAVHACGIVHRDLKPANVFIRRDARSLTGERVTILDFGISKMRSLSANAGTKVGSVFGTAYYMPPEQTMDTSQVDARGDIYSLGCVLHEMLAGRPPFDTNDPTIILRIRSEKPAPLSSLRPDVSPLLEGIVLRCLEKRPEDRYPSAAQLSMALLEALPRVPEETTAAQKEAEAESGRGLTRTVFVRRGAMGQLPAAPRAAARALERPVPLWFALGLAGVVCLLSVMGTRLASDGDANRPVAVREKQTPPAPPPADASAPVLAACPAGTIRSGEECIAIPIAGVWGGAIAGLSQAGEAVREQVTLTLLPAPTPDGCGRLQDERCSSRLSRCTYDAAGRTFRATLVGCDEDVAISGTLQKSRLSVRVSYAPQNIWTGSLAPPAARR